MIQMNIFTKQKQTFDYQRGNVRGRANPELGMNMHTLLYI